MTLTQPGRPGSILIVGATSGIARPLAAALAARGHDLVLTGRDPADLKDDARDLAIRYGVAVRTVKFDADTDPPEACLAAAVDRVGAFQGLVVALGAYAREEQVAGNPDLAQWMDRINHRVPVALVRAALPKVDPEGFLCVISSVAGDRVRPSLASYARSKADLNAALEAIRRERGPRNTPLIVTAKPGPTDTRMTWGLSGPATPADPRQVAADIVRAIFQGRVIVYTPGRWRWIMAVIRLIPGPIFHRLFRHL